MRNTNKILLALAIGGATVLSAPLAHADKYEVHNYYGDARYHDRDDDRYDRPHYRDDRGRKHKKVVVHHHYYHEPVRERVVVVERPVYVEQVRYEEPPRYYRDEPAYYPPATGEYRSATPMIVGGIIGGVLGNQMGKGRGKDAATVAGVLLGGSIGRDVSYRQ
jgi:uncharacterized protein YcfJ